ncbi:hypothetical protein GCM10010841_27900 [Deinococcus aerophilus]|uniref:Uncharacterized protein n=1 Tax=Deinococcus aerophilus TaxID=522488 RepID=A0ABQ2GYB4_9DEIO|nr:hypothetical protein GCM10010841_27900 [Deinococcus aerophilus]
MRGDFFSWNEFPFPAGTQMEKDVEPQAAPRLERQAQLRCGPEALKHLFHSTGRSDYPRLQERLADDQRPVERQASHGKPMLFRR